MAQTFTVDSRMNGRLYEDHGVTAEQVANARLNAARMGVEILAVTEETQVDPAALAVFGVHV